MKNVASGEQITTPGELHPALVGALISPGMLARWRHAMATIFSWALKGVLEIGVLPGKVVDSGHYKIYRTDAAVNLQPWEETFLDNLFTYKGQRKKSTTLEEIGNDNLQRYKFFKKLIKDELERLSYLDENKNKFKKRLLAGGFVGLFLFFLGIFFVMVFLPLENWTMVFIPFAGFHLSFAIIVIGFLFSPLSEKGLGEARKWKSFSRYIKEMSPKAGEQLAIEELERILPYATTFGLAVKWLDIFKKDSRIEAPFWYKTKASSSQEIIGSLINMTRYMDIIGGGPYATGTGRVRSERR